MVISSMLVSSYDDSRHAHLTDCFRSYGSDGLIVACLCLLYLFTLYFLLLAIKIVSRYIDLFGNLVRTLQSVSFMAL